MPEKIGKYEIAEQIGVGGFGAVYRGRDPFIKRTVAIKTCQLNDEEIKSRFFREAELAGNLHHRNITTIFDFGVEDGVPYIVQEFLTGEDLDKVIKRKETLSIPRKIEILMALTEGLGYAHQQAIIHRDIKPSNIRILDNGSVKIMDFGIAKSLLSESSLTQTGITLGTSAYLAPEQIRGEALDQRTDIFALGVLAYELFSYRKPFRGEHLSTVLYKILNEEPERLESMAPDVPASVSAIVSRAIQKNLEDRYSSMEELHQDLVLVYRQLVGSSARIPSIPRLTQATATTSIPFDPDATVKTPSKGMTTNRNITPPSGALARLPARDERTPTVASARRPAGGLELVNFRDPSDRTTERKVSEVGRRRAPRRTVWIGGAIAAAVILGAVYLFLSRSLPPPVVQGRVKPVPTAPIVFPQPQLGQEPSGSAPPPTAAPAPIAAPKVVEAVAKAPEAPKPPTRFRVQFSSLPMATLFVDGRRIGPSIPVQRLDLSEGEHTVRFEHADFPPYERRFRVFTNGESRIQYRFPIGYLVIHSPAWAGANVLIDLKFKGVLTGEKTFPLKSGPHRVTLSREGVHPYTADITLPEGERKEFTPPPPVVQSQGS